MNRQLLIEWMARVDNLGPADTLFIRAESKIAAKKVMKAFEKEIAVLQQIDPIAASRIFVRIKPKDGCWWCTLQRVDSDPLTGYIKRGEGTVERIVIDYDPERAAILKKMVEDGLTDTDIAHHFPDIKESEWALVNNWRTER